MYQWNDSFVKWTIFSGSVIMHVALLFLAVPKPSVPNALLYKKDRVRVQLSLASKKVPEKKTVSSPIPEKRIRKPAAPVIPHEDQVAMPVEDMVTETSEAKPDTAAIPEAREDSVPYIAESEITEEEIAAVRASWENSVRALVEQHKKYPRQAMLAEIEGVVTLHMVIERSGTVRSYIVPSGKNGILERGTLASMASLKTVLPIPDICKETAVTVEIPLVYKLQ